MNIFEAFVVRSVDDFVKSMIISDPASVEIHDKLKGFHRIE